MAKREQYNQEIGVALDKDDNDFDVTEWRKELKAFQNTQDLLLKSLTTTMNCILEQSKTTNELLERVLSK